jgi:histidyl-tRNA synthetase
VELLKEYYAERIDSACEDCRRRLEHSPLRLLDCKQDRCQPLIEKAPNILNHLCEECADHFGSLLEHLDTLGRKYTVNHRMVRGLDYYTKTVFEVWAAGIGAQAAVCGGGRYDGLAEIVGGPPTPGVGVATGIERIILVMKEQGVEPVHTFALTAFVAHLGPEAHQEAIKLSNSLRQAGVPCWMAFGERGLKSQLREANKREARYAVILGEDELARGVATVRDMASSEQTEVKLMELATWFQQQSSP